MAQAQIMFTTDEELKLQTMRKLKKEWSSLKALLQYAMRAYVNDKISLGILIVDDEDVWTPELEKTYQERMHDFEQGKNYMSWDELIARYSP